ncbi:MAG TPA: malate dehydrogenase [Firmicutes bacterium]|jgi:L-2-hydroxycarboxylate dehydrogenase (NAD+)|nr:malate dehydrogenase [Bacillota bacterium]
MGKIRISPVKLKNFCCALLQKCGVTKSEAVIVADNLIEAELRGVRSHGVSLLTGYTERLKKGAINTKPEFKTLQEGASFLAIDADYALGAVAGKRAMSLCLAKAKNTGIGCVTVTKATHFGMAAYYSMMALEREMIGIALCNSGNIMATYGGIDRVLGTNPMSIAVPSEDVFPLVYDGATSQAAYGKIAVAALEGKNIPGEWALNQEGQPTTNAKEALQGILLPFGGYKGSGLALMVQILSAVLGSTFLNGYPEKGAYSGQVGFFFEVIDISRFTDLKLFKKGVAKISADLKAS